jgi:hypothetical protein
MKTEISILALAVAVVLSPGLAAADVNSFKDWTVVCDNLRTCQVAGFAPEDSESSAMLRLSRAGQAGAPARSRSTCRATAALRARRRPWPSTGEW